jgi:tetratricopeptide (TPR) repeat protein
MLKLAQAQLASRDELQALSTYGKVLALRPNHVPALLAMGHVQANRADPEGAAVSFRRALQVKPDEFNALSGLVKVEIARSRYREAQRAIDAYATSAPASAAAVVPMLRGDVEVARGNGAAAVAHYTESLSSERATWAVAGHAYASLYQVGLIRQANALADAWMARHPEDTSFLVAIGSVASKANDPALAEARYRAVLKLQPDHLGALNNLAWLLAEQNKTGGVALAERAQALQPESAQVLDTLAHALAAEGQLDRAIETQLAATRKATRFTPDYHLALARLYVRAGRRDDARAELQRVASLGSVYPRQQEVAELLKAAN